MVINLLQSKPVSDASVQDFFSADGYTFLSATTYGKTAVATIVVPFVD